MGELHMQSNSLVSYSVMVFAISQFHSVMDDSFKYSVDCCVLLMSSQSMDMVGTLMLECLAKGYVLILLIANLRRPLSFIRWISLGSLFHSKKTR